MDTLRLKEMQKRGFTLIEILVVVAIIALLIAILLPSLASAREQARAAACLSNIRQLGMGIRYFADANRGYYPDSYHWFGWPPWYHDPDEVQFPSPRGQGKWEEGWIMRYVGRQTGIFLCPSDDGYRSYRQQPPPFSAQKPGHGNYCMQKSLQELIHKPGEREGGQPFDGKSSDTLFNRVYYKESTLLQPPSRVMLLMEQSELGAFNDCRVGWTRNSAPSFSEQDDKLTTRHHRRGHMAMFDGHAEGILAEEDFNVRSLRASRKSGLYYDMIAPVGSQFRIRTSAAKPTSSDPLHSGP
jgi:prepilin-type N-terminal cleavage/methylation domain-containing protein